MAARPTWDPWQEMRRLQREMEQLFGGSASARWPLAAEYPPVNLTRDNDGITLEAMCPGVNRSTLEISVVGDSIAIRGERPAPPEVPEDRFRRRERILGAFTRTIGVGERLDADRAQATYADGILRVRLARAPEATPKTIPVQS